MATGSSRSHLDTAWNSRSLFSWAGCQLVSQYCTDQLHTKNSWGRWLSTRPGSVLCQPCLFLRVCSRSSWAYQLHRVCWIDAVRDVCACVAVRDLLVWLGQELAFSRITADLVNDIDRRILLSCCRERVGHWRPRLQCSFPLVAPQDWSRLEVLVLDHLLDNAMCHALKFVHQAF